MKMNDETKAHLVITTLLAIAGACAVVLVLLAIWIERNQISAMCVRPGQPTIQVRT